MEAVAWVFVAIVALLGAGRWSRHVIHSDTTHKKWGEQ